MSKTAKLLWEQRSPASGRNQILPSRQSQLLLHENSAKVLMELIAAGAQSQGDLLWRNTCEWLLSCKVAFRLLTLRHDSVHQVQKTEEAETKGYDPDRHGAYFGIDNEIMLGSTMSPQAHYGEMSIVPFAQRRFPQEGKLVLVGPIPLSNPQELKRMISYEVHHAVAHEQPESDADQYRSEFNARWIAGYHKDKSDRPLSAPPYILDDGKLLKMHNARQQAIFIDIYNTSKFLARAWNHRLSGHSFQKVIYNYHAPQGKNLIHSVRIDNLYLALTKSRVNMAEVGDAMKALADEDKEALRSPRGGMVNTWHDILRDAELSDKQKAVVARDLGIYGFPS